MEVVALHDTLETFTLGNTKNIDNLASLKESSTRVTLFLIRKLIIALEAKLFNKLLCAGGTLLRLVSSLREIQATLLLVIICDLNRAIAVLLRGFHLKKFVSVHVDDSDGDHAACLIVKDTSHTYFFTEDSEGHGFRFS